MLVSFEIQRVCSPGTLTEEKLMNLRVALGFARIPDGDLDNFAMGVIKGIEGNAAYPTPPVPLTDVQAAVDDFVAKVARSKQAVCWKPQPRTTRAKPGRHAAAAGHYVQLNCSMI